MDAKGWGAVVALGSVTPLAAHWGWSAHDVFALSLATGAVALYALPTAAGRKSLLLNDRGRWSLSSFQMLLWTWLVLSTLWCLFILRLRTHLEPLELQIDQNLWVLLGISGASFVAAPIANDAKARAGVLPRRGSPTQNALTDPAALQAGARDLVLGDDAATADVIDLSRVQLCFLTVVCVLGYAATIWQQLAVTTRESLVFPGLSEGLVALLGISHATYIANKLPRREGKP